MTDPIPTQATAPAQPTPPVGAQATTDAPEQRDALLDAQRKAQEESPRNFKQDALDDKVVRVEPDGTGPSPMGTLDAPQR